jgi:hypothetical protein
VLTPGTRLDNDPRPHKAHQNRARVVLEKRGWFGELLECRALSELHPVLGLAVLKGRKMFAMDLSFAMSVHLRKTDLPPLRGGRVFKLGTWG